MAHIAIYLIGTYLIAVYRLSESRLSGYGDGLPDSIGRNIQRSKPLACLYFYHITDTSARSYILLISSSHRLRQDHKYQQSKVKRGMPLF